MEARAKGVQKPPKETLVLIDSHCHLDAEKFNGDRDVVIRRAREKGVKSFITIGCDVVSSGRAQVLSKVHNDIFCSAGIHPHEAGKVEVDYIEKVRELAGYGKCVAIGECGLDYFYDHAERSQQRDVFRAQIELAKVLQMPLVVHVRDAWDDCLEDLETCNAYAGVIHCFTGTQDQADRALALGFYISIPGIVTFKKAGELHRVVPTIPEDRLLIETDSPYLAPAPHRGKRNEPAFVEMVAQKVAELRGSATEDIEKVTGENAQRLFGLKSV